jgi:hypothetical protein
MIVVKALFYLAAGLLLIVFAIFTVPAVLCGWRIDHQYLR